jgi:hypothetical protein
LREAILPYIFYDDREVQRLTIERGVIGDKNYSDSKGVAVKLGFKAINEIETEFELNKTEFNWNNESLNEIDSDINPDRFEELRKRAFFAYKTLYKISDELLMSVDDDKGLKEVADEVRKYTWKLEDLEWEKTKS